MPRKSTKKKEEENTNLIDLRNMELIIKAIADIAKTIDTIIKYDGITAEITNIEKKTREQCKKEITDICGELKLKQFILEDSKNFANKFILQFPDMLPVYTQEEIDQLYIANFKWLLDDSLRNKPDLTKQFIIDHTPNFVKLAVTTYYRSNVNQYREKLEDYLNNTTYRQKLNILFLTYLDEYWSKRK